MCMYATGDLVVPYDRGFESGRAPMKNLCAFYQCSQTVKENNVRKPAAQLVTMTFLWIRLRGWYRSWASLPHLNRAPPRG